MEIGYVHRGIEKLMTERTYTQNLVLAEKVCGICSTHHSTCYALTVEGVLGLEIPDRASHIRTVVAEIERLHSHLLWFGLLGHTLGNTKLFDMAMGVRERVMDLSELITGNRVSRAMNAIGGVRRDLTREGVSGVKATVDAVEKSLPSIGETLKTREMAERLKGVGVLTREEARSLGVVGPTLRGSGVEEDIRRLDPYLAYDESGFDVAVEDGGDVLARGLVRLKEIRESTNIIRTTISGMPEGDLRRDPAQPPTGEGLDRVEAPRGELAYFVKANGSNIPERVKIRTPSYVNDYSILQMAEGERLSDFPVIVESIDPCFSCTDRVTVIDAANGSRRAWSLSELARRSRA
jgi:Ni,Fe-hydrogenase III large subunit